MGAEKKSFSANVLRTDVLANLLQSGVRLVCNPMPCTSSSMSGAEFARTLCNFVVQPVRGANGSFSSSQEKVEEKKKTHMYS